jgi:hypothetical protein
MYNTSQNTWTFKIANNTAYSSANCASTYSSAQGIPSSISNPGCRYNLAGTMTQNEVLWFYGGQKDSNSDEHTKRDLWSFNLTSNEWTWWDIVVNSVPSVYTEPSGTFNAYYNYLNVPHIFATPGSRSGSVMWTTNNTIQLFGGSDYTDLWAFDPNLSLPKHFLNTSDISDLITSKLQFEVWSSNYFAGDPLLNVQQQNYFTNDWPSSVTLVLRNVALSEYFVMKWTGCIMCSLFRAYSNIYLCTY